MKVLNKRIFELDVGVATIIASCLFTMVFYTGLWIPYFITAIYFFISLLKKGNKITINSSTILVLSCMVAYLLGNIMTNKIYNSVKNDFINIITMLMLMFILDQLNQKQFGKSLDLARKVSVITLFSVSLLTIFKYIKLLQGVYYPQFRFSNGQPILGTALNADNSMFSLAMFIGVLMAHHLIIHKKIKLTFFYYFSILTMSFSLLFSGSRRTYLIFTLFILLFLVKYIYKSLKGYNFLKNLVFVYFFTLTSSLIALFFSITNRKIDFSSILKNDQLNVILTRMSTISPGQAKESFLPRTDRWVYAIENFNDFPTINKIFGNGFDYLEKFIYAFPSNVLEDYAHNPIISALLYSGIVGTLLMILMLLNSIKTIYLNRNVLGMDFLLSFIITFLFIFIAGNSIFSFKITLFLISFTCVSGKILKREKDYKKNYINSQKNLAERGITNVTL